MTLNPELVNNPERYQTMHGVVAKSLTSAQLGRLLSSGYLAFRLHAHTQLDSIADHYCH